jgi:hypothetical protein
LELGFELGLKLGWYLVGNGFIIGWGLMLLFCYLDYLGRLLEVV